MKYLFLPKISILTQSQEQIDSRSCMIKEMFELLCIITKFCCVYGATEDSLDEISSSSVVFWDIEYDDVFPENISAIYQRNHEVIQILISDNWDHAKKGYEYKVFRVLSKADFKNDLAECIQSIKTMFLANKEIIHLKGVRRNIYLMPKSIMYFQGTDGRRTLVYGTDGCLLPIEVTESLDRCEEYLHNRGFLRIHRSHLINMYFVQKVSNYRVHFNNEISLCIAQKRYSAVCEQYDEWVKRQTYIIFK